MQEASAEQQNMIRLSVRELVEFTLHGEDIRPGGSMRDMLSGMLGHQARQKALGEGWISEMPVSLDLPVPEEDTLLHLQGRMDAFLDGEIPAVEEIKLWQGKDPPAEAFPAHMAQAVCYAHMHCVLTGCAQIRVRVCYVRQSGRVCRSFDRKMTAEACQEVFIPLLEAWLRRRRILRRHQRARDASLAALQFPYPSYRAGQREMAAQVYTAIKHRKRLFASMPTGSGKSMAALFPALKALGLGLTDQVYYLTARTTQRAAAADAVALLRRQQTRLWVLTLNAKEKQCPVHTICHPDFCPRAKGHFLRDSEALEEMLQAEDWTPEAVGRMADQHQLCPFEFSLSLAEAADLVICDYNYALDPAVHIQRIFDKAGHVTLLIDEAHNLLSRVREMLGGNVDGAAVRRLRTSVGKAAGRKHPLYLAMTALLKALDDLPVPEESAEGKLDSLPQSTENALNAMAEAVISARGEQSVWHEARGELTEISNSVFGIIRAIRRAPEDICWIWQGRKQRRLTAFVPDVSEYLSEVTASLCGLICFSATLDPLPDMKLLLGGGEEDACFSLPSPFPPENLRVYRCSINTRYTGRADSAPQIAAALRQLIAEKPGKHLIFFPSFAYLQLVQPLLPPEWQVQKREMTDADRLAFLAPYREQAEPVVSLCVMGGVFSESIDLPGRALDGVAIVGLGLPTVDIFQETLRAFYEERYGSGFRFAYQIPGMQKVAQAVGRLIRTETDKGTAVLIDDRYAQQAYQKLLPVHWAIQTWEPSAPLPDMLTDRI